MIIIIIIIIIIIHLYQLSNDFGLNSAPQCHDADPRGQRRCEGGLDR